MRFRLWFHKWLPLIGPACLSIGGLGMYTPRLIGLGVSPSIVFNVSTGLAIIGAIGTELANMPPWLKTLLSGLYPVTPAMHDAAVSRLVLVPPPKERITLPEIPPVTPEPPKDAA